MGAVARLFKTLLDVSWEDIDDGQALVRDGDQIVGSDAAGGVTDHGDLTGLGDNDHPQYALAADVATDAELAAHVTDATDAHAGSAITNTPAGNIAATTVQAAINELDGDKAAASHVHAGEDITSGTVADARIASTIARDSEVTSAISTSESGQVRDGDAAGGVLGGTYPNPSFAADMATQAELDAHTGDTSAAHAASAISADSTTLVGTGTDVQAVLEELDNGIADHLADTSDAHDASAISIADAGGYITGTDVEAAIQELGAAIPGTDGWTAAGETWTYASGSGGGLATFTVAGVDVTTKYAKGTRIKLTQTTAKYFVVVAVSFSTDTTVTIMAGSDYTLANAAITSPFYSYQLNPRGYPGMFTFAPAVTGFSSGPTLTASKFGVSGSMMHLYMKVSGTSNATTMTWVTPVNTAHALGFGCLVSDNGVTQMGRAIFTAGGTTVTMGDAVGAGGNFTASGTKGFELTMALEI